LKAPALYTTVRGRSPPGFPGNDSEADRKHSCSFEMISKVNEKIIAEERKKKLKMIRKLKKKKILR
jgi:hypothetical protein